MIVCLFPVLWLIAGTNAALQKVMETRLENFYQCPDKPNTTVRWRNMLVNRVNAKESQLNGEVVITDVVNDLKLTVEMYKCASKSASNTCEYYTSMKIPAICDKIEKKIAPWYQYWNATNLPKKCPLSPRVYEIQGVKIIIDTSFPLFDGYWRFKNQASDHGKLVGCFFIEISIHRRFKS